MSFINKSHPIISRSKTAVKGKLASKTNQNSGASKEEYILVQKKYFKDGFVSL